MADTPAQAAPEAPAAPQVGSDTATTPEAPTAPPAATTAPPEPTPGAPPAPPPPGQQTEALRMLMVRENQVRRQEAAIKQQSEAIARAEKMAELAKSNPLQFLQNQGVSYDDVTRQRLAGDRLDPVAPVRNELAEVKQTLRQQQEAYAEGLRQQQIAKAQDEVTHFVNESTEYPLTKAAAMSGAVFDYLHAHFVETGEQLSEAVAAQAVETQLSELYSAIQGAQAPQANTPPPSQPSGTPTLTNQHSATPPSTAPGDWPEDDQESLLAAARLLQFSE